MTREHELLLVSLVQLVQLVQLRTARVSVSFALELADARSRRDTYHSGMTTSHTHSEVVSLSN